jgi:hypothetical protein
VKVSEWFPGFLAGHIQRHRRGDWPPFDAGAEFYRGWMRLFVDHGVTAEAARDASERLMADELKGLDAHPRRTTDLARQILRETAVVGHAGPPDDRAEAERLSAGCGLCDGSGQAIRSRADGWPFEITTPAGRPVQAPTLVFACVCPMGRFLLRPGRDGARSPFPDLAINGREARTVDPRDRPADDLPPFGSLGELVRALAPSLRPDRARRPPPSRWTDGPAAPTPNVAELPAPNVDPDLARRIAEAAGRAKDHPQPGGV